MKRDTPIRCFAISLFILRPRAEGCEVLLLRRTGATLPGEWCQVAGGIEQGETAWQAALREAEEETGLVLDVLYSADICEQFYEADRDAITIAPVFVAFADSDCKICLNNEHSAFQWSTFEAASALLPFAGQRSTLAHIKREFVDRKPNPLLQIETRG